ncbi:1,4-alpha-glucan-branching enzyme 3, chloroplastic/amyloplastic [Sesbania bispinosa]|nr:1,4-alpha-glucan-branching enzyme 3, chloroplastic/amyloplastic [Sesbania bispinosa]
MGSKAWTFSLCCDFDNGKEYNIFNVVVDLKWDERICALKPPIAYWLGTRKGRKAWLQVAFEKE